jgi:hypothetical protein
MLPSISCYWTSCVASSEGQMSTTNRVRSSADEMGRIRYKLRGHESPEGGPGPDYIPYILYFSVVSLLVDCRN